MIQSKNSNIFKNINDLELSCLDVNEVSDLTKSENESNFEKITADFNNNTIDGLINNNYYDKSELSDINFENLSENKSNYVSENKSNYVSENKSNYVSKNKSNYVSENKSNYASENKSKNTYKLDYILLNKKDKKISIKINQNNFKKYILINLNKNNQKIKIYLDNLDNYEIPKSINIKKLNALNNKKCNIVVYYKINNSNKYIKSNLNFYLKFRYIPNFSNNFNNSKKSNNYQNLSNWIEILNI